MAKVKNYFKFDNQFKLTKDKDLIRSSVHSYRGYVAKILDHTPQKAYKIINASNRESHNYIYNYTDLKTKKTIKNPVRKCTLYKFINSQNVTIKEKIKIDNETQKSINRHYYANLNHCGNIWLCPDCSNRLLKYRESEVKKVFDFLRPNYQLYMLTLTIYHSMNDKESIERILKIWQKAIRHRSNDKFFNTFKYWIKAVEVRFGANGMHPHIHLIFAKSKQMSVIEFNEIVKTFTDLWKKVSNNTSQKYKGFELTEFKNDSYIFGINKHLESSELTIQKNSIVSVDAMYLAEINIHKWNEYASQTRYKKRIQQSGSFKKLKDILIKEKSDSEILNESHSDKIKYIFDNDAWQKLSNQFISRAEIINYLNYNKIDLFNEKLSELQLIENQSIIQILQSD